MATRRWWGVRTSRIASVTARERSVASACISGFSCVGAEARRGRAAHLAVLPLHPPDLGRRLKDRELERPRGEAAPALEGLELAEQRGHGLVGRLVDDDVDGCRERCRGGLNASATPGGRRRGPSAHGAPVGPRLIGACAVEGRHPVHGLRCAEPVLDLLVPRAHRRGRSLLVPAAPPSSARLGVRGVRGLRRRRRPPVSGDRIRAASSGGQPASTSSSSA